MGNTYHFDLYFEGETDWQTVVPLAFAHAASYGFECNAGANETVAVFPIDGGTDYTYVAAPHAGLHRAVRSTLSDELAIRGGIVSVGQIGDLSLLINPRKGLLSFYRDGTLDGTDSSDRAWVASCSSLFRACTGLPSALYGHAYDDWLVEFHVAPELGVTVEQLGDREQTSIRNQKPPPVLYWLNFFFQAIL